MKRIIVLGSTGSIGKQTLDIVRDNPEKFEVIGLSCKSRIDDIIEQIKEFNPLSVCVNDDDDAHKLQKMFPRLDVFSGRKGLCDLASIDADIVVSALMGISGLEPTYMAIKSGKDIALANKETLVTGGKIITDAVCEMGVKLLPVDSEHSAIFQSLQGNRGAKINRILLTASGGPFRNYKKKELESVTLEQALNHPKWSMGSKITIDSATMMNKGLEVIEAKWFFDVEPSKIEILVHPESIVHSMVEYEDKAIIAQLGLPDMHVPIAYALNYPDRLPIEGEGLNFFDMGSDLHFERPKRDVFKCIDLAYGALKTGGSAPALLNGANEELVGLFLNDKIKFIDIQNILQRIMEDEVHHNINSIEEILEIDKISRNRVRELLEK